VQVLSYASHLLQQRLRKNELMRKVELMTTTSLTFLALAAASFCGATWAQVSPAGAAQRSIEEAQSQLPIKSAGKSIANHLQDFSGAFSMDRLDALEIKNELLRDEIQSYWKRFLGRPVSVEEMIAFKTWLYNKAKNNGFMAYAQTDSEGNTLQINLVLPRIKSVTVFAKDGDLAERYVKDLSARFEADFKPGSQLDVLALDQKLDAVSFTMPLELDVIIRSAGPELVDLVVNVSEASSRKGEVLGGLVQANNFGLKQFGRAQLMAQLAVGGNLPTSKWTLTGQKSAGIAYVRSEYDTPWEAMGVRFHAGLGSSRSEGVLGGSATSVIRSTDGVVGLEKLLGQQRDFVFKGVADVLMRQSQSNLSSTGLEVTRTQDRQLRVRMSADNDRLSSEPTRLELAGTMGKYPDLVGLPNVPTGTYSKLEFNSRKQFNISGDGQFFGLVKVRGQRTSHHVDGTNQMSIGGANGVRAYTSVDGLGDDAVVSSLELNYKNLPNQSFGVFYDGGLVRASKTPLTGVYPNTYSLQAVGIQSSGNNNNWYYNWALAKGIGGNRGALTTDTESSPNNWRLNASLTYTF